MSPYTESSFVSTIKNDFDRRRGLLHESSTQLSASAILENKALGHPQFEELGVGERRTAPMVAVFLDLTNFTGRTFWDHQDQVVDLAHAVLSGFVEVVQNFGGHPLGLRGDGLFAGFSPGDPAFTASMALSSCAFALSGIEQDVNPWLKSRGIEPLQARAGLDFGEITFVRTGSASSSEINPLGFAANFAAKCEKIAKSWEIVVGQGLTELLPDDYSHLIPHADSPKKYTRNYESQFYKFYDYRWRNTIPHIPGVVETLAGTSTSQIIGR